MKVVPSDGIHNIFRLSILFDEMLIDIVDLFIFFFKLFNVFEEFIFIGTVFKELFPKGRHCTYCFEYRS